MKLYQKSDTKIKTHLVINQSITLDDNIRYPIIDRLIKETSPDFRSSFLNSYRSIADSEKITRILVKQLKENLE